jgi:hypothetical protein
MVEAAVAVPDAADLLDEQLHGFVGSVVGSAGVEVGQELLSPQSKRAAEPADLRNGGKSRNLSMSASAWARPAARSVWRRPGTAAAPPTRPL